MSKIERFLFEFPTLACLVVGFFGSMTSVAIWFICDYIGASHAWIALAQTIGGVSIVLFTIGMVVPITWSLLYGEYEGSNGGKLLLTLAFFVFGLAVGTFIVL